VVKDPRAAGTDCQQNGVVASPGKVVAYIVRGRFARSSSRALADAYHRYIDEWTETGLEYVRGEAAGDHARALVAALMSADTSDVALTPSVSGAAGLVAAQLGPAARRPFRCRLAPS
jgi:hypothetical protein